MCICDGGGVKKGKEKVGEKNVRYLSCLRYKKIITNNFEEILCKSCKYHQVLKIYEFFIFYK